MKEYGLNGPFPYYPWSNIACSACGPSGTGCACAKGKCECSDCPNNAQATQKSGVSRLCSPSSMPELN